jgi:hypothetical protein
MTLLRLANPIVHQMQPTPVCCTATCIAMALGIPVTEMGVDLEKAYNFDKTGPWLAERGIWMRPLYFWNGFGERLMPGRVYLVGIRSQNKIGTDHAVLLDTRGAPKPDGHERSGWLTFDPNEGIEGKNWISWIDEHGLLDAAELVQRNSMHVSFGIPPVAVGT